MCLTPYLWSIILFGVLIEVATADDASEILILQKLAFRSEAAIYTEYNIPPLTESIEDMMAYFQKRTFLKATIDGRMVGSVNGYTQNGTGYIGRLIVHPDFQNQGIGTKLMHAIEARLTQSKRFEIFTGYRSERNIHLYEKLGYQTFRTEPATDRLTMVFMEKLVQ